MSDFLCCKPIIKNQHSILNILINSGAFPGLVAAKYKTLANEKLCLNNLLKKLVVGRGENKSDRLS